MMFNSNSSICKSFFVGLMTCLMNANADAQYVPKTVNLNLSGGTLVLPPAGTAEGDMLRGQGAYLQGLGAAWQGKGAFYSQVGDWQIKNQQAYRMSLENRKLQLESNRQWRERCERDRQALSDRRELTNINTYLWEFRDRPDANKVASGKAINYLISQFGPHLANVNFGKLQLTNEELDSVRLQTTDGITADGLAWSFDDRGRISWPDELRIVELNRERSALEDAFKELRLLQQKQRPVKTQIKRISSQIDKLRLLAGNILRVKKQDEIGADSSREFLKHLNLQICNLHSSDQQEQIRLALQPQVRSATELMRHVAQYNLRFAPCEDPTASAYIALHGQLAASHRALQSPSSSLHAKNGKP